MANGRLLAGMAGLIGTLALSSILSRHNLPGAARLSWQETLPKLELTRVRDDFSERTVPKDESSLPEEPKVFFPEALESDH